MSIIFYITEARSHTWFPEKEQKKRKHACKFGLAPHFFSEDPSKNGGYFLFFSVFAGVCFNWVDSSEALFLISPALEAMVR